MTPCVRLGLNRISMEKDLWVCWTRHEFFQLSDIGARLFFKGGTSFSKAWRLIDRFSENIDIVILILIPPFRWSESVLDSINSCKCHVKHAKLCRINNLRHRINGYEIESPFESRWGRSASKQRS